MGSAMAIGTYGSGWTSRTAVRLAGGRRVSLLSALLVLAEAGCLARSVWLPTVAAHPVAGHWYRPESWWRSASALRETWTEYVKWTVYLLGCR